MSSHDVERALAAAVLDARAAQLADVQASMRADVDRLAESWREGYGQQLGSHQDRMQAMRDETRAWINTNFVDGEPASTQDVPHGQGRQDASGAEPATAPSASGRGEPNPAEADAERALAISNMDMKTYSQLRASLGVRSDSNMDRLFGATR